MASRACQESSFCRARICASYIILVAVGRLAACRCLVGQQFLSSISASTGFEWANDRADPGAPPKWGMVATQVGCCSDAVQPVQPQALHDCGIEGRCMPKTQHFFPGAMVGMQRANHFPHEGCARADLLTHVHMETCHPSFLSRSCVVV
jgi:hypothetical protein